MKQSQNQKENAVKAISWKISSLSNHLSSPDN